MNGQKVLLYSTIAMVIITLILTVLISTAASKSDVTNYQSARSWAITSAVICALAVVVNIGALSGWYYYDSKGGDVSYE